MVTVFISVLLDMKRRVVDCFLFYNEVDMLEYRLSVLWEFVDFFIVSESKFSFVGNEKPFFTEDPRFEKYREKMIVLKIETFPFPLPDISRHEQWCNENYQRDYLMRGVRELLESKSINENDVLLINDVDEIPDTSFLNYISTKTVLPLNNIFVLQQKYHCYDVNVIRNIDWYHSKCLSVKTWKELLHSEHFSTVRLYGVTIPFHESVYPQLIMNGGWHLSYFGDVDFILNKVKNFSHQEICINIEQINERKSKGIDITGRTDITYSVVPVEENSYLPPKPFFFCKEI